MRKKLKSINKKKVFQHIFNKGVFFHGRFLVLRYAKIASQNIDLHICKFGYIVTRKSGSAVKRNLLKRRIKSILRNFIYKGEFAYIMQNNYFIISVKSAAKNACFVQLEEDIARLMTVAQRRHDNKNRSLKKPDASFVD